MFDLDLITKAAAVAVRPHVRRAPWTALGKVKKSNLMSTIGLEAGQVGKHVNQAARIAQQGVDPARRAAVAELAGYYKNLGSSAGTQAAQHALTLSAQKAQAAASQVAGVVAKKTPTMAFSQGSVLQHAAQQLGPQKVIQGAVQHGAPVIGSASVLDHLSQMPFGKLAAAIEREYSQSLPKEVEVSMGRMKNQPRNEVGYGTPNVFGAADPVKKTKKLKVNGVTVPELLEQLAQQAGLLPKKTAAFNPPNTLTPKSVTETLEALRQSSAAKRLAKAGESAVQKARYDARQMGAAVGSSR